MKKTIALIFIFSISQSQDWVQNFQNNPMIHDLYEIDTTADDGFIVSGGFGDDSRAIKLNSLGDVEWQTGVYGTSMAKYIEQLNNNYYLIIAGEQMSIINESGQAGSGFIIGIDYCLDAQIIDSTSFIGVWSDLNTQSSVRKVSTSGQILWEKNFNSIFRSVDILPSGEYFLSGFTSNSSIFIKLNLEGDTIWSKNYNLSQNTQYLTDGIVTSDLSFIAVGSDYIDDTEETGADLVVIKLNSSGDSLWTKRFGGQFHDYSETIIETFNGNYLIAGYKTQSYDQNDTDAWLLLIDPNGELLWSRTYGEIEGQGVDKAYSAIQSDDGSFVFCGLYNDQSVIVKTNYIENSFVPQNKEELQSAVNLWTDNNEEALNIYGEINTWDVFLITDMSGLFRDKINFNEDLSNWNVSNVNSMSYMFYNADAFDNNLNNWNVSNVTDMEWMFANTELFNGDISNWNVSNVTDMKYMFSEADTFNVNLSNWNVSNVADMSFMFSGAFQFDGDITNWNVSNVQSMSHMFQDAFNFNQNISNWDVSNVTNMSNMFNHASSFNQNLSDWNIINVIEMYNMFDNTSLTDINKCAIHTSFSYNENWTYDWENFCAFIAIEEIDNQIINEDEPININIEAYSFLSDELTYFAESDTSAMPVYIDGTSIAIGLEANWNGIGIITVTVTDENQLSDTTDFTVTVLPVNDAPQDFNLVFPTILDTIQISTQTDETVAFHWEESVDVDSDVNYLTTVTLDYFGNVFTQEYESDTSSVSIPGYEWAVLMTNQNLERWTLQYSVKASDEEYEVVKEGEFVFQITSLSVDGSITPLTFSLYQNYPNPFNPITTLKYDLPEDSFVDITVYDMLGNVVNNLINKNQNSGSKSVQWDATNNQGEPVSAGVYLYKIQAGEFSQTKKMILLK